MMNSVRYFLLANGVLKSFSYYSDESQFLLGRISLPPAEGIPSAKTLVIVASTLNGQTATLCSWINLHYHNSTASWIYFVILVVIGL